MIKTIFDFLNRYSIGRNESVRLQEYSYPVPTIEEVGKEILQKQDKVFLKLRVSELEDQLNQLQYDNIVLTTANKELKRQNEKIATWYVSTDTFDHVMEELKQAEEDVEVWKQKYLKARQSGYDEGYDECLEDSKK